MEKEISSKRKYALYFIIVAVFVAAVVAILNYYPTMHDMVDVQIEIDGDVKKAPQMYYTFDATANLENFSAGREAEYVGAEGNTFTYQVPSNSTYIRFHFNNADNYVIKGIRFDYDNNSIQMKSDAIAIAASFQGIDACFVDEDAMVQISTSGKDPFIAWDVRGYQIDDLAQDHSRPEYKKMHLIALLVVLVLFILVVLSRNKIVMLLNALYDDKRQILSLSKTDFKAKYSGSYFGIFWAFVQPVVTIAIYTFVFQVGFKAGNTVGGYPFLLYLVAGIIPWFFFAEGWGCATNCLIEYNYLVKKVVFKIDILPIVKIISSMFVHIFFIGISVLVYLVNGRMPGLTFLQIPYYMFCTFAITLALSYLSAAITPFFKDISQIINILTQLGMWTIPIMYDEGIIGEGIMRILRFNPLYYVVTGYRDCFMHGEWFWNDMKMTLYFWIVVAGLFVIGYRVFQKLKVHFADVL